MTNVTLPLLSAVSRDVRKKHKILGAFTIVGLALSIMSFISFAAVGFTVVATHGEVGMWYAMIPFAGFICGGVTGAVCGTKRASCAAVIDILDRVEQSDKQVIFALASTSLRFLPSGNVVPVRGRFDPILHPFAHFYVASSAASLQTLHPCNPDTQNPTHIDSLLDSFYPSALFFDSIQYTQCRWNERWQIRHTSSSVPSRNPPQMHSR